MKKLIKSKKFIIVILISLLLAVLAELNLKDMPKIFKHTINKYKSNDSLMNLIGGYLLYEYSYDSFDLEKDTLNFNILIKGNTKNLESEIIAVKKGDNYKIINEIILIVNK